LGQRMEGEVERLGDVVSRRHGLGRGNGEW
jgi:hypothetical protein